MTDRHHGRRYLVTGAGSGIGQGIATLLAGHGARVVVSDVQAAAAESVAGDIVESGGDAVAVHLDVAERDSWVDAVERSTQHLGGLDGLVNNAGITRDRSLGRMSDAEWGQVIDVHLRGTWLGCQVAAPVLAESSSASIVNISSSGRHGSFGQTNYAAAKAGIVGLTKTVALELARRDIRCNAVAPGAVDTPMLADVPDSVRRGWLEGIALRRLAAPSEIAEAVAFLLSPASSYVTAHVLDVNGGETHL